MDCDKQEFGLEVEPALNFEQIKILNLAQDILEWTRRNDWGDDWVIGGIASKEGYDKLLRENAELKNKILRIKTLASQL